MDRDLFEEKPESKPIPNGEKIEILCACDEQYLAHAATMICSLVEHNKIISIHFLYAAIGPAQLDRFRSFVQKCGCDISVYEISADLNYLPVDRWASVAVYYRLLAANVLPPNLEKVLYLDCDLIVRRSLAELWTTDISNHALAAVPDSWGTHLAADLELAPGVKYFNSGVLLINLQFWRDNFVFERAVAFIRNNPERVPFWDQDALNAVLVGKWVELPERWNMQSEAVFNWLRTPEPKEQIDPRIVHFTTATKPWHWASDHLFKNEYRTYRKKTPWHRYQEQGRPSILRRATNAILPRSVRSWLRKRVVRWSTRVKRESADRLAGLPLKSESGDGNARQINE